MKQYRIDNDTESILEIQEYLLTALSPNDNPGITKTGLFDAATQNAVLIFQENEQLDKTGVVDAITWERLYFRHDEVQKNKLVPCLPEHTVFGMQLGDTGYHIIILQTLLGEFSKIYPTTERPAITGQFGLTTVDAVRSMQRNYGVYADGIVTPMLWNRMLRDHQSKKQLLQYSHLL